MRAQWDSKIDSSSGAASAAFSHRPHQRHVVDDDEFRRGLKLVDELPERFVIALAAT